MDLEIIILSKISQSEKDSYHKMSLIYGILKHEINEQTKLKQTLRQKQCDCQRGGCLGDWEKEMKKLRSTPG